MRVSILIDGLEYRAFDHIYAVSACGKVIKRKTLAPVPGRLRKDGYRDIGWNRLFHRMVATCWVENPTNAPHVHHLNHDKSDNRACNLAWVTPKQHMENHAPQLGRYERSEATREKIRQYRLGRPTSEATKQKQREANLRLGIKPPAPQRGVKLTEAHRLAISRNHGKAKRCEVDGVAYNSFAEAGKALGIRPLTLRKRCMSSNFERYKLLDD
ncbi:MAG: HNH endonuclease [Azospirillum sp.]|nr:HNH endonuclease [Azospirillum sp.]